MSFHSLCFGEVVRVYFRIDIGFFTVICFLYNKSERRTSCEEQQRQQAKVTNFYFLGVKSQCSNCSLRFLGQGGMSGEGGGITIFNPSQ